MQPRLHGGGVLLWKLGERGSCFSTILRMAPSLRAFFLFAPSPEPFACVSARVPNAVAAAHRAP